MIMNIRTIDIMATSKQWIILIVITHSIDNLIVVFNPLKFGEND